MPMEAEDTSPIADSRAQLKVQFPPGVKARKRVKTGNSLSGCRPLAIAQFGRGPRFGCVEGAEMNFVYTSNRFRALLRRSLALVAACILIGVAGCSGSEGIGNPPGGENPPPPTEPPIGNARVTLVARDVFGAPVQGASIALLINSGTGFLEVSTVTDANGRAELVGGFDGVYAVILSTTEMKGASYAPTHPADDQIDFEVILHPLSALTAGIGSLSITGSSADGRQLEFTARLYIVEGNAWSDPNASTDFEAWNLGPVSVLPCESDIGGFAADCVEGSAGFDASYQGSTLNQDWVDPNTTSVPLAISLLLDQGASLAVTDPADRRLLAAKYFQTRLGAEDQMVLAAFAADNATTGKFALLPSQPLTIFPVENPSFTTDGSAYFSTIDSLATLEGGESPLHAAIGEMIDFTASSAPADSRRAVVVLASGGASDCSTQANCQAVQDTLRNKSAIADVAVFAIGLSEPSGPVDLWKLGMLAQAAQGAVFWAQDATQVPTVLGRLPEILDGRHAAVDVTIRLESPVDGAFASGRTVGGTLHVVICPWDCTDSIDVPFALRVP